MDKCLLKQGDYQPTGYKVDPAKCRGCKHEPWCGKMKPKPPYPEINCVMAIRK